MLVSDTQPIQQFGLFGGLGIALGTLLVLTVTPKIGDKRFWSLEGFENTKRRYAKRTHSSAWQWWHSLLERNSWTIVSGTVALIPFIVIGLGQLTTSVQPSAFFRPGSTQLESAKTLEADFCGLDSFDVVIEFERETAIRLVDQLIRITDLRSMLQSIEGVEAVIAADLFFPKVDTRGNRRAVAKRSLVDKELIANQALLEDQQLVATTATATSWRLSARVSCEGDFDALRERLNLAMEQYEEEASGPAPRPSRWWIAGTASLFREIEKQFLRDLIMTLPRWICDGQPLGHGAPGFVSNRLNGHDSQCVARTLCAWNRKLVWCCARSWLDYDSKCSDRDRSRRYYAYALLHAAAH